MISLLLSISISFLDSQKKINIHNSSCKCPYPSSRIYSYLRIIFGPSMSFFLWQTQQQAYNVPSNGLLLKNYLINWFNLHVLPKTIEG